MVASEHVVYSPLESEVEGNRLNFAASRLALFEFCQEKVSESGVKSLAKQPTVMSFPLIVLSNDGMSGKREGGVWEAEGEEENKRMEGFLEGVKCSSGIDSSPKVNYFYVRYEI